MTDEDGFIGAIVTNPDDRTVRLAYADWLDERGDPRAAFLRFDAEARPISGLLAIVRGLDPAWVGLMNIGLRPGDVVRMARGLLEGIEATVCEVDLKLGVARVLPHMFCFPAPLPEVHLGDLVLLRRGPSS